MVIFQKIRTVEVWHCGSLLFYCRYGYGKLRLRELVMIGLLLLDSGSLQISKIYLVGIRIG